MTTGKRMKERRNHLGQKAEDVAEALGVARATVYRYENGEIEKVPRTVLDALSKVLCTTPAYLMGWEEQPDTPEQAIEGVIPIVKKSFQLLGSIACGEPSFADVELDVQVASGVEQDADFCLHARSDSMIGARIHDGDIVFIRKQDMVDDGDIAAVLIGDEATLKRVQYDREAGVLQLFAENPRYKTLRYAGEELNQIWILGKAIAFQSEIR